MYLGAGAITRVKIFETFRHLLDAEGGAVLQYHALRVYRVADT